jgi:hypothetical protein
MKQTFTAIIIMFTSSSSHAAAGLDQTLYREAKAWGNLQLQKESLRTSYSVPPTRFGCPFAIYCKKLFSDIDMRAILALR